MLLLIDIFLNFCGHTSIFLLNRFISPVRFLYFKVDLVLLALNISVLTDQVSICSVKLLEFTMNILVLRLRCRHGIVLLATLE